MFDFWRVHGELLSSKISLDEKGLFDADSGPRTSPRSGDGPEQPFGRLFLSEASLLAIEL